MTHDEDEDEDDEDEGFHYDGFRGAGRDPWRFGFSFGSDGVRMKEPPVFGQVLREMEEIFSQLGQWEGQLGHFDVPSIAPPSSPEERTEERRSRNSLRDFMLKTPDTDSQGPSRAPQRDHRESPSQYPNSHFKGWTPRFKFDDILRDGHQKSPHEELKEDRDFDSEVQSRGLDQILDDSAAKQPTEMKPRVFFKSVSVTKVVKPDGSMEERRTVTDSQGNKTTEVTHTGAPGVLEDPQPHPTRPGGVSSSDMSDDQSLFSKLFKGFK